MPIPQDSPIPGWEAAGLMTPEKVLERLHEEINEYINFTSEGYTALKKNFDLVCGTLSDGTKYWDESIFVKFLKSAAPSSSLLFAEAGPILYNSALYLGSYPFPADSSRLLTCQKLVRFLFWVLPKHAAYLMNGAEVSRGGKKTLVVRARTAIDQRRVLFQSLAEPSEDLRIPIGSELEEEQSFAAQRAREVPKLQIDYAATNFDSDGDEMYHDILDVLSATVPAKRPAAPVARDDLRQLAERLHSPKVHLRQLVIKRANFKSLAKLLLVEHQFPTKGRSPDASELESAAEIVVQTFSRSSSGAINWRKFDWALTQTMPHMFSSLANVLGKLFQTSSPVVLRHSSALMQPQASKIFTYPLISLLGFLLAESADFDCLKPLYASSLSDSASLKASSRLISAIKSSKHSSILLISGRNTMTSQPVIFGAYFRDPVQDEKAIQHGDAEDTDEHTLMFQLAPIFSVFRSNPGNQAWIEVEWAGKEEVEVWFGERGRGFAIDMAGDLRSASVAHWDDEKAGTYNATKWRGNWLT